MVKTFQTPTGAKEIFFAGSSKFNPNFNIELNELLNECLASSSTKPVWMRFHLSDIANQAPIIYNLLKDDYRYTLVGQGPTNLSHIALEAYWIEENNYSKITKEISQFSSKVALQNYTLSYFAKDFTNEVGSFDETNAEFNYTKDYLAKNNATIYNNLLRTWIYCRDIDNNYAGLVKARRELFTKENLISTTHYIASTGIEALSYPFNRLVTMDNFMLTGHQEEQVIYLKALENLSPTALYGVTFERATKVCFQDRACFFISGTASIDKEGNILYLTDVVKQTKRAIENIQALLAEGNGSLDNLMQVVVYLRDMADANLVESVLASVLSSKIPRIMVKAPVCRPGWLVEIEGIALKEELNPKFAPFA
jgi:enamine deaminase RidA (YjgF/YER057c/UK114 family)